MFTCTQCSRAHNVYVHICLRAHNVHVHTMFTCTQCSRAHNVHVHTIFHMRKKDMFKNFNYEYLYTSIIVFILLRLHLLLCCFFSCIYVSADDLTPRFYKFLSVPFSLKMANTADTDRGACV